MSKLEHGSLEYKKVKEEILSLFGVVASEKFNPAANVRGRVSFLKDYLKNAKKNALVLGISGGVDSSTAGRLCQLACEELREEGYDATFYAVRLPAGVQKDEEDAQAALRFIKPDHILTVNIGEAANLVNTQGVAQLESVGKKFSPEQIDYHKGNIKARLRMVAQYQVASISNGLVVGTEISTETLTAFFTRWGDQACDINPMSYLNKTQGRLMLQYMGAEERIWKKMPTADLEELNPGKPDSEGMGFPYDDLDAFVEGKMISPEIEEKIINIYNNTRFKRDAIPEYQEERYLS